MQQYVIEEKMFTSDFEKYPLYSLTIENGITPKTDRYERSFLVKKEGDTFKILKGKRFAINPMNLRFGAIGYNNSNNAVSVSGYYDVFSVDDNRYNDFWLSLLKGTPALKKYNSVATGSLIEKRRVYFADFKNLCFRIPLSEERNKISNFIELLEDRIEKQRRLVEALKSYKRGVLNLYISSNEQVWGTVCLSHILTERKEYCEKDGTYPHATLSKEGVSGKTDRYDRDYLVSSDDKKYKVTRKGDLCYNPANLKFGVICLNNFGNAIFSPIYITFEISKQYNRDFIGQYLMRPDFINKALRFQQGTVYERMAVSPEDLLSMNIKLPKKENQDKIASFLSKMEKEVDYQNRLLTQLVFMKEALLRQLFI